MSLKSDIKTALDPIYPTGFHVYTGTSKNYITFFFYNQATGLIADDAEVLTSYGLQVDVYSNGNLDNAVLQVKKELKKLGYSRSNEMDLFDIATSTYRKNMSFRSIKQTESLA